MRAAAGVQFSAVAALRQELQAGLEGIREELAAAEGRRALLLLQRRPEGEGQVLDAAEEEGRNGDDEEFVSRVGTFVRGHGAESDAELLALEGGCADALRALCESYFGEQWDARDPSRTLAVVRDFLEMLAKAVNSAASVEHSR